MHVAHSSTSPVVLTGLPPGSYRLRPFTVSSLIGRSEKGPWSGPYLVPKVPLPSPATVSRTGSPIQLAGLVEGATYSVTVKDNTHNLTSAPVSFTYSSAASAAVYRDGNLLKVGGTRWVANGICQYVMYGTAWWNDGPWKRFYDHRVAIAARYKELGINLVRMSIYGEVYENIGGISEFTKVQWQDRIANLCSAFTTQGIRVMLCAHDATGIGAPWVTRTFAQARDLAFPMFTDLLATPGIGDDPLVMWEPWNEPGSRSGITDEAFVEHYTLTINLLRAGGYDGLIVVDPAQWAVAFSPTREADPLLAIDGNLAFANHRYPLYGAGVTNSSTGYVDRTAHLTDALDWVEKYPMLFTEHGQDVDDTDPTTGGPRAAVTWVSELLDTIVATDLARGHNGGTMWMANWSWNELFGSSSNYFTATDWTTLTTYGTAVNTNFWAPVKALNATAGVY